MIIHVVKEGDTVSSIAEYYGVSASRLAQDNEIKAPYKLALGEALVILIPRTTYLVQEGDTIAKIADAYGVTVMQLLQNNPFLSEREYIYTGEMLVIDYEDNKILTLSTNGYAYPFIDQKILRKTLPFLTYVTIYSYMTTDEGDLIDINDIEILQTAKDYGVAPIMMVTALADTMEDERKVINSVLSIPEKQDVFIENVLTIMKTKGYYAVNINTPYIFPQYRKNYVEFIEKFANRIHQEGFQIWDTLSLSTFEIVSGTVYKSLEYEKIGQIVDKVILIAYQWGYSIGVPSGVITYETILKFVSYMIDMIPPEKLSVGATTNGYIWKLPFEEGISEGNSISYNSAIDLAIDVGAEILYDKAANSAYFQYVAFDEFIVRFKDARSMDNLMKLLLQNGIDNLGVWNIMIYFAPLWLVANSQYEIEKIIT